ncbi:hypothetical protein ES703_08495 [subsurface metagenome]
MGYEEDLIRQDRIDESERLAVTDPRLLTRDELERKIELTDQYNDWKSGRPLGYEEQEIIDIQIDLLAEQDPIITRYAFGQTFPPGAWLEDPEQANWDYLEEWVANFLTTHWAGDISIGLAILQRLGFTREEAMHWLGHFVIAQLDRYGWIFRLPYTVPTMASLSIISPSFIAKIGEITGLKEYELQDKVDRIVYECTAPMKIGAYIEHGYAEQAKRAKRTRRFRTYFMIAMAALIVLPVAFTAFKSALTVWSYTEGWMISTFARFKLALTAFTDVMGAGFSAFLTAINYDALVGVHKIAELVSKDYRVIMSKVYGEITRVSEALGYGPYTLLLLTQNSKKLIQDVSSTFGMEWDLSEVQWLSTFQDYMTKFSGAAYRYRDNPEALLFDLSRWVERDALNAKGAFMAGLTQSVNEVLKDVENFVGDLVTIKEDINTLVMGLPEKISLQIGEAIEPYISKFDDFVTGTYDPYRRQIGMIVDTIQAHQTEIRDRANELRERLKKPADYLLEIDYLEDWERLDQERKIDDLSSRYYKRAIGGIREAVVPINMEMKRISEIVTRPLELVFMGVEEVTAPVPTPIGEIDPSKTWFVGDF